MRRGVRATRQGPATWRLEVRGLPAGRHTLRVVARDAAGLHSAAVTRVTRTRRA
jgi:hypothetical protein